MKNLISKLWDAWVRAYGQFGPNPKLYPFCF